VKLSEDSEVYYVSEVLPIGRVANLTSLLKLKTSLRKQFHQNSYNKFIHKRKYGKEKGN